MQIEESDARRFSGASERNREPIREVLAGVLPEVGTVLEIASGTGQHAAYFATNFPGLTWQPSEIDAERLESIRAWRAHEGLANLAEPLQLDVTETWPIDAADAVFNANMIHISPWEVCVAFLRGVNRVLSADGVLVTYGPYKIAGAHTAPSNAAFDEDLRSRNAEWGVRELEAVVAQAEENNLRLESRVAMPANNFCLVFRRSS